jgi:hypothetical protein
MREGCADKAKRNQTIKFKTPTRKTGVFGAQILLGTLRPGHRQMLLGRNGEPSSNVCCRMEAC